MLVSGTKRVMIFGHRLRRSWDASSQPTPSYPQQSLNVIAALVQRYSSAPALLGFGLLNEPTVSMIPYLHVKRDHRTTGPPWGLRLATCFAVCRNRMLPGNHAANCSLIT